jgi:hypothetical protein
MLLEIPKMGTSIQNEDLLKWGPDVIYVTQCNLKIIDTKKLKIFINLMIYFNRYIKTGERR